MKHLIAIVGAAITVSLSAASPQTAWPLSSLTVPEKDLPGGCQVKPNPWSGTSRSYLIELRKQVDGVPKLPDAPPLSAQEIAAADGEWARHVREGYQAIYEAADGARVTVSAIRFDDPRLVSTDPPPVSSLLRTPRGVTERLVKGDVAVRLTASSKQECYQKILAHVRGLQ